MEDGGKKNHWERVQRDDTIFLSEDHDTSAVVDTILLYYLYAPLEALQDVCKEQIDWGLELKLNGRIRVAAEGLNGTLDGNLMNINNYTTRMDIKFGVGKIHWKLASYPSDCLRRFKGLSVKETKEVISTDLCEGIMSEVLAVGPGVHLTPEEWHNELENPSPEMVLIDTRNYYETRIGRFQTSNITPIDPCTRSFSDFTSFVDKSEDQLKGKKILMYCTGGVRCERASAYVKLKVPDALGVYQLFGGIHNYQEHYPSESESFFKGKNFVYDPRISVPSAIPTNEPVGICLSCSNMWDDYSFQVRCTICRVLVLMCADCRSSPSRTVCEKCSKPTEE